MLSTKKHLFKTVILGCIASIALSGCQGTEQAARDDISATAVQANVAKQAFKETKGLDGPGNVRIRKGVWLGGESTSTSNGMPLPGNVETADAIAIASQVPMGLVELTRLAASQSGIEITGANQLGLDRPGGADLSDNNEDPRNIQALIDYTGPLSGLLDMISAKFGVSWEYRGGVIRIFDFDTRSFTLVVPSNIENSLTSTIKSTINNNDATSSSSGNNSNSNSSSQDTGSKGGVETTAKLNYWARVAKDVDSLVPEGTKYSISPESGTITITARPQILDRVANYVKDQNTKMSRQVAISVKILSITEDQSEGLATDIDAVFSDASAGIGATFNSLAPGLATVGTSLTSTITKGKFSGTTALIQALSQRSNVSLVTSGSTTAMNNQPAPIQVSSETSYINKYDSTSTDNSTVVTPETAKVTTGFSMNVLPRILPDGRVALQYNVGLSSLDDLKTVGPTDFPIQTPEVSSRGFQQNVMLKSGDTLILGGFERADNSTSNNKGDLLSWALGGNRSAEKKHELLVVLLTPVIIENPADLARMK